MKKLSAFLLACMMLCGTLVSCDEDEDDDDDRRSRKSSVSETTEDVATNTKAPDYEKALAKYFDYVTTQDSDNLFKFVVPSAALDALNDTQKDYLKSALENNLANMDGVTFELKSVDDAVELDDEQIELLNSYVIDLLNGIAVDFEISEAYEVSFTYEISKDGESMEDDNVMCMFRIDGDGWKVYDDDAASLEDYSNSVPEITTAEPTTAQTTTAVTTTAAETTTLSGNTPAPHTPTITADEYKISPYPSYDFFSLVFSMEPLEFGGTRTYSPSTSILPDDVWDELFGSGRNSEYDKEFYPFFNGIYDEFSAACGENTSLSIASATNTVRLTPEQLDIVNRYYASILKKYNITDISLNFIGGYSADVKINAKGDTGTSEKVLPMICVTTDTNETCALPYPISEIEGLIK